MLGLVTKLGLGAVWEALRSPLGRIIILVVAFLAWTWWSRYDAAQEARAEVRAEYAAEVARQREQAVQLASEARERADEADAELARLRELRDDLVQSLGPDACDIPDDVRERLRDIR